MYKSIEEMQTVAKDGFDAYVASANTFTKGFQTLATDAAEFTKKSFEDSVAVTEKVVASKSIEKAVELQQAHATKTIEGWMAQANKFGQFYMEAAKDAYKPFEKQVEKFAPKAAAK
jgi:hypothetical protein